MNGTSDIEHRYPTVRTKAPLFGKLEGREVEIFAVVLAATVMLSTLSLLLPWTLPGGRGHSVPRALFTAVNAATLTGIPHAFGPDQLEMPGRWTVAGAMVVMAVTTLWCAGCVFARLAGAAVGAGAVLGFATALWCTAALWATGCSLIFGPKPIDVEAALFNGIAAASSCGLRLGGPAGTLTAMVGLLPAGLLTVIGVLPLLEALKRRAVQDTVAVKRPIGIRLSALSRCHLMGVMAVYGLGVLAFVWLLPVQGEGLKGFMKAVVQSQAHGLNVVGPWMDVGTDMGGLEPSRWPRAMQFLAAVLTLVGTGAVGLGGGLWAGGLILISRSDASTALVGRRAMGWVAACLALFVMSIAALLSVAPTLGLDRILLVSAGAVANSGAAAETLAVEGGALYVLSLVMICGRFLPLLILSGRWRVWWDATA